jgi:hypothetical protein
MGMVLKKTFVRPLNYPNFTKTNHFIYHFQWLTTIMPEFILGLVNRVTTSASAHRSQGGMESPGHGVLNSTETFMHRIFATAALLALLAGTAPAQAADPDDATSQGTVILGAYAPSPVDTPDVQDARNAVQAHLPSLSQVQVLAAYTQVVSGLNVKLICTARQEGRPQSWKFVVYRHLDGRWELTQAEQL